MADKKIHRKEVTITGVASTRVTTDVITSSDTRKYRVLSVIFTETTATENNDMSCECWLESEMIQEINIQHLIAAFDSETRVQIPSIPINVVVPPGDTFKVGIVSGTTLSTARANIEYVIEQEQ